MSPIKMFVTIRSQPHLSKQQFHDHWRHPHGTWGRGISNILSYIQCHRIDTPMLDAGQQEIDGIVEVGIESASDVGRMSQDPVYLNQLKTDEPNFVENTGFGFLDEDVIHSGPGRAEGDMHDRWPWREIEQPTSIKLIQVMRGAVSADWRLANEVALGQAIGAVRQVCSTANPFIHSDPDANTLTAIRQLWWPTYTAFEQGVKQDPAAWRALTDSMGNGFTGLFQAERFI